MKTQLITCLKIIYMGKYKVKIIDAQRRITKGIRSLYWYPIVLGLIILMSSCISQIIRSGVDTAFDPLGIHNFNVPLNQKPQLMPNDTSLLGTIPPLKIFIPKFEDKRNLTKVNQVGEFLMGNTDFTTSKGYYMISKKQMPIDSLVTLSIINELKRHNHIIISDTTRERHCDFILQGKVIKFWVAPTELATEVIKGYDYQVAVKIELSFIRVQDKRTIFAKQFSRLYAASSKKGFMNDATIGSLLDKALLDMVRYFTKNKEMILSLRQT